MHHPLWLVFLLALIGHIIQNALSFMNDDRNYSSTFLSSMGTGVIFEFLILLVLTLLIKKWTQREQTRLQRNLNYLRQLSEQEFQALLAEAYRL